jgi:hypothetical protein
VAAIVEKRERKPGKLLAKNNEIDNTVQARKKNP